MNFYSRFTVLLLINFHMLNQSYADHCSDWFRKNLNKDNPTNHECCERYAHGVYLGPHCSCGSDRYPFNPREAYSCSPSESRSLPKDSAHNHDLNPEGQEADETIVLKAVTHSQKESSGQRDGLPSETNGNKWNETISKSRSERQIKPLLKHQVEFIPTSTEMVIFYKGEPSSDYTVLYSLEKKRATLGWVYRKTSPEPAFRIEEELFKIHASKINNPLPIEQIKFTNIQNKEALSGLKIDFWEINASSNSNKEKEDPKRTSNFEDMKFFETPLGWNALDFIKALKPMNNPFDLIEEITLEKGGSPHLTIKLKPGTNATIAPSGFLPSLY